MSTSNRHYMPELHICLSEAPFSNTQVTVSWAMGERPWLFQEKKHLLGAQEECLKNI